MFCAALEAKGGFGDVKLNQAFQSFINDTSRAVVLFSCGSLLSVFDVRVSVTFHRMFLILFEFIWVAEWPPFEKRLLTRLTICSLCSLPTVFVISVISRFGFEGGIWDLISPVLGQCTRVSFVQAFDELLILQETLLTSHQMY